MRKRVLLALIASAAVSLLVLTSFVLVPRLSTRSSPPVGAVTTPATLETPARTITPTQAADSSIEPYVGGWHRHRTRMAIDTDGTVTEAGDWYISSKVAPDGGKLVGKILSIDSPSSEYGLDVGTKLTVQPGPARNTIIVSYGAGSLSLQFCRDGTRDPTGGCGA
jgi:hypothetical protein